MPASVVFRETEGQKLNTKRDHLLAIKWHDVQDAYLLSTSHDDQLKH
jgi:hypothetical protein